jgi:hypothetical protein
MGLLPVAQSSKQTPFTSEMVAPILATDSCDKIESVNVLPKVVGFLQVEKSKVVGFLVWFPPTWKVDRVHKDKVVKIK